jgi:hypothetical protein
MKVISLIKKISVFFGLIPKTMKGKEFLKRIFLGKLVPIPAEIQTGITEYKDPIPLSTHFPTSQYKILYAIGKIH